MSAPSSAGDEPRGDAEDTKERFAADLRKLRLDAKNPTLAKLQDATGISRTVLSDAFSGRQVPTARTVDGIVRACGGSSQEWLDRRDALVGLNPRSAAVTESSDTVSTPRTVRRSTAGWLAVGAFAVGAVVSATVAALVATSLQVPVATTPPEAVGAGDDPGAVTPQIVVSTGEDPALTACVDDAKVATADTRADGTLLEIIWSNKCYSGWGRITRYDAKYEGNTVTIAIYPETAPDGPDRQEATEHDVQGAYTTLVVRPTPDTLLCADGSFTVDGESIDLGEPICI